MTSADTWNDLILAYKNGAPVRIRDVGQSVFDTENNLGGNYFVPGAASNNPEYKEGPAVSIGITKQPGSNVIKTIDEVKLREALSKAESQHTEDTAS